MTEAMRLIPGSGRSPGEGNGNPLQFSCLENSMDRGVWRTIVHWAAKELDMTIATQIINNIRANKFQDLSCDLTLLVITFYNLLFLTFKNKIHLK